MPTLLGLSLTLISNPDWKKNAGGVWIPGVWLPGSKTHRLNQHCITGQSEPNWSPLASSSGCAESPVETSDPSGWEAAGRPLFVSSFVKQADCLQSIQ